MWDVGRLVYREEGSGDGVYAPAGEGSGDGVYAPAGEGSGRDPVVDLMLDALWVQLGLF